MLLQMASFLLFKGMYVYYFFTHLPIIGHLGEYGYFFDIVFPFSLEMFSGMELIDHTIVLIWISWGRSTLFSIVAARIYLSTHRSSSAFVTFIFLIADILTVVRWYRIVSLICISLMTSDVVHPFMLTVCPLYVFFGKMSI